MRDRTALHLISGFLGSGKTTILRRMLNDAALGDSAVVVNEIGEIGLDHHLLKCVDGETVLLRNGCVCCSMRDDLAQVLKDLLARRAKGSIPSFSRIIVEGTGLADPVPILGTVHTDLALRHHLHIGRVVTVVDAVNGAFQHRNQPEFAKQVAIADHILLSKTDIATPGTMAALTPLLRTINPGAPLSDAGDPNLEPVTTITAGSNGSSDKEEILAWTTKPARFAADAIHETGIHSFCMVFDHALDWAALGIWLTMLLHAYGDRVLRVKGLLSIEGSADPIFINGVQHIMHPPLHLDRWPDEDRRSRLVFIIRDLPRALIERSARAFLSSRKIPARI